MAVAEAVGRLRSGQSPAQLVDGDVPDERDVRTGRSIRIVPSERGEIARLPSLTECGRDDVSGSGGKLKHLGVFGFVQEQSFVGDSGVGLHLLEAGRLPALLDLLATHDGIADVPDDALS